MLLFFPFFSIADLAVERDDGVHEYLTLDIGIRRENYSSSINVIIEGGKKCSIVDEFIRQFYYRSNEQRKGRVIPRSNHCLFIGLKNFTFIIVFFPLVIAEYYVSEFFIMLGAHLPRYRFIDNFL